MSLPQDNNQQTYFNHVTYYRYRWTVPITYISNRNNKPTLIWFDKDEDEGLNFNFIIYSFSIYFYYSYVIFFYCKMLYFTVAIEVDEHTKWIKLNVDQVGFYRVNYDDEWVTFKDLLHSHYMVKIMLFQLFCLMQELL